MIHFALERSALTMCGLDIGTAATEIGFDGDTTKVTCEHCRAEIAANDPPARRKPKNELAARRRRIKVPAEKIRTREEILKDVLVFKGLAWVRCNNCGGTGNYPSAMNPPGRCRFLCWAVRKKDVPDCIDGGMAALVDKRGTSWAPTFGLLPKNIDAYVKKAQAADARGYRDAVIAEEDRPAREAAERERAERRAKLDAAKEAERQRILAEKAKRVHVGTIGERFVKLPVTLERIVKTETQFGTRYGNAFRDLDGNAIMWWGSYPVAPRDEESKGLKLFLTATVKDHSTYNNEAQTTVLRAKVEERAS